MFIKSTYVQFSNLTMQHNLCLLNVNTIQIEAYELEIHAIDNANYSNGH